MNFKKIAYNYKNINQEFYKSTPDDDAAFYCQKRGCVNKSNPDEWIWDCPVSVKHY